MDLLYIKTIVDKRCKLEVSLPIVLGVSGGPDSLFLLDVLFQLGYSVVVAHFNHHLREESENEARVVEKMAKDRNYEFVLGDGDVRTEATRNKRSIEEQARISRYTFLFHTAVEVRAQAVAVAHTADDQVETILMHFLRGSGLNGLAGMPFRSEKHGWNSNKPLVRPLLETWRNEIEKYCLESGLTPLRDPSNLDSQYYRNRIRNELIPLLEDFNPKLKEHIINLSKIVQDELIAKKDEIADAWATVVEHQDENQIVINLSEYYALNLAFQRQVLRMVQMHLAPEFRNLDFTMVERIIDHLDSPSSTGSQDWIAGIHFLQTKKALIFYKGNDLPLDYDSPQIIEKSKKWDIGLTFSLTNGWNLKAEIISYKEGLTKSTEFQDPNQAWLDAAKITFPLDIRQWKKGDKIQFFGMAGKETKLSNFWINQGVARHARIHYPLVCNQEEILWIPGLRGSELFRITEKTKKILHLQLTRDSH
jgi:tRNA(Ile)-lysidine synthase